MSINLKNFELVSHSLSDNSWACRGCCRSAGLGITFADLQVHRVVNVLDQLLTPTRLLIDKALQVQHKDRRELLQSHSPADFNL